MAATTDYYRKEANTRWNHKQITTVNNKSSILLGTTKEALLNLTQNMGYLSTKPLKIYTEVSSQGH